MGLGGVVPVLPIWRVIEIDGRRATAAPELPACQRLVYAADMLTILNGVDGLSDHQGLGFRCTHRILTGGCNPQVRGATAPPPPLQGKAEGGRGIGSPGVWQCPTPHPPAAGFQSPTWEATAQDHCFHAVVPEV